MSAGGIKAGGVFVEIGADPRQFFSALSRVNKSLGNIGKSVARAGAKATAIGVGTLAPFAAAVRQGAAYQSTLLNIQASTGATAAELEKLRTASMQMSQAMGKGPTEIAGSFLELLKAGMSVEQVLGGAGKAAIEFAAVGQMDVAQAAVVMSDAMNVFGVDAAKAANSISSAADASSTSIELLSQSFSMVSAVAALANQSIDDTSAALAILANAGVKGSDAGTSLKTMLLRLMAPANEAVAALNGIGLSAASFRDASGKMLPMVKIIGVLNGALDGLDQAAKDDIFRQIFGSDAIRAAAILTSTGVEGFNNMTAAMGGAMSVSEKYKTLMGGLAGANSKAFAAMERLSIAVSDAVTPSVMKLSAALVGAIEWLTAFVRDNPRLVASIAQMATAAVVAGAAFVGLGTTLRVLSFAIGGFLGFGKAIVTPLATAASAAIYLGKTFSVASIQLASFASRGVAAIAQFAAQITAQLAITSAKSGAVAANYFAGTISIVAATVARAAEGNMRAAAIGVQALAKIGTEGTKSALIAGASVARLTSTGGTQLLRLGVQGSTALATIGTTALTTGATTAGTFATSTTSVLAYAAASISSAAATAAAWAAANFPLLALVGVIGGAVIVVTQLVSLVATLAGVIKDSFNTAVAQSVVVFGDLYRIATTTFATISDALMAGDMELAMEAAMAGVLAGFTRGANALMSKVDETAANILNTWDAFKSIAAQPLMMFDAIKDPLVEADRKALRERQDARLAKVGENDVQRAAKATTAENKVKDLASVAASKRADVELSRVAGDRLSNAKTMTDVDIARQMIGKLLEADTLTGEAEQRLVDQFQSKFADMMRPAESIGGQGPTGGAAGPMGFDAGVVGLVAKIAGATDMKQLGSAGKQISSLIESDKLTIDEENSLLNAFRDQQNRLADMEGIQRGVGGSNQAEVAGTFSSAAVSGMGFGSSLAQRQLDELKGIHQELKKDNAAEVQS
jgi:TP901 family phage tail tape measure protein